MLKTVETNGFIPEKETWDNVGLWEERMVKEFGDTIKDIEIFFYGPRIAMCDVRFLNRNYGSFNIHPKSVRYVGCRCSNEENEIFERATMNDELFNGTLGKDRP